MGIRQFVRLSHLFAATIALALLATAFAAVLARPAQAGTPTDQKLDIPFPPDGKYMFRTFDESDGRIVFGLPSSSSSPFQVFSWTAAAGLATLSSGGQDDPAVDGDVVVWVDGSSIKGTDLSTGARFDLGDGGSQSQPDVSGDWVVWDQGYHEVRAHNIVTGESRVLSSTTTGLRQCPRICGDLVVWMDQRLGLGWDIWGCRLSGGPDFPICTAYGDQMTPETDGQYVVWNDWRTLPEAVYARDMTTDTEFAVEPGAAPAMQDGAHIGRGLVTWSSDAWGGNPAGLYARKLPSGVSFFVCEGGDNAVPDGDRIYHRHGTDVWCATLTPIAGSLSVHQYSGTPRFTSDTTVDLDVVAHSDEGTITEMDFGDGWEPFAATKRNGPLADGWHVITAQVRDDAGNEAQILSPPFYVDTVAPITTWSLTMPHSTQALAPGWFNTDIILHLGVLDASGVGTVYSQVNGGDWLRGGPLRFDTRADHSLDGWYTVKAYSKDAAGNQEATAQTIEFGIDTLPPTAVAAAPAVTRPGRPATLRFTVRDRAPGSGEVRARIVVLDRRGRRVLRLAAAPVVIGAPAARRFVCHLSPGRYRYQVIAIDGAGNRSVRPATDSLVVR